MKFVTATLLTTAAAAVMSTSAVAATLNGATGYALASGGNKIDVIGDLGDPTSAITTLTLTGGQPLAAIAYRPVTGELYGYSTTGRSDAVYTINLSDGSLVKVDASFAMGADISPSAQVGFDFNNAIDAARAVSTADDNLVFFPAGFDATSPRVARFTDLKYRDFGDSTDGDMEPDNRRDENFGADPEVFANAYTNAVVGRKAASTFQYGLDADLNTLVSIANNTGVLDTIAEITLGGEVLDFSNKGGFDILSMIEGDNLAVALLTVPGMGGGNTGIYTIDLSTGAATLQRALGRGGYTGFAAAPGMDDGGMAPVPVPAAGFLLVGALGALGAARRKR